MTQYTFVNVCFGAEQKLFKNVKCNHVKPSSHISQLHPFDAPCWRALPNYGTDAGVIQVNESGSYWDYLFFGSYTNSGFTPVPLSGKRLTGGTCSLAGSHMLPYTPPDGSYEGNFHTPGRNFTASLPTRYFLGWVVSLTADAHPLARANLRPMSVDLLPPHLY
ncbi:hypothetical protein O181_082573 [Austropuccinia psidii MF-1]|uniref:Uncharacterized protein n=1 Tax=Austropuccinia psidii MF-1 TaxID=1389203 RepID=A0A9Q3IIN0_9BASI|nr:hypothetical protein [Austropuccinia psidii MF-1]